MNFINNPGTYSIAENNLPAVHSSALHVKNASAAGSQYYFYLVSTYPDRWKMTMCKEIQNFSKLEANWDGYNAYPIHPKAISNAEHFIYIIPNKYFSESYPEAYPDCNGTVCLQWENSGEIVNIEIGISKSVYFSKLQDSPVKLNDSFNFKDHREVSEFISELEKLYKHQVYSQEGEYTNVSSDF